MAAIHQTMKKHYKYNRLGENDPNHYKWGFLYYDPSDHHILVPKKIAWMGWTFNFANPFTYLIILCVVGLIYLLEHYFHI